MKRWAQPWKVALWVLLGVALGLALRGALASVSTNMGALLMVLAQQQEAPPTRTEGALRELARSTTLGPTNPGPWRLRGVALRHADPSTALAAFHEALRRAPADPVLLVWRGNLRARQGDEVGALDDWRAAGAAPIFINRARVLLSAGESAKALTMGERAVAIAPQSSESWLLLGDVHWTRGDRTAAADAFQRGLALPPPLTAPPLVVPLARARLAWARGDYTGSEAAYRVTLPLGARVGDSDPYVELTALLLARGQPAEAEAILHTAITQLPEAPAPLILAGDMALARGDTKAAAAAFQRAAELDPSSPQTLLGQARLAWHRDDLAGAEVLVSRVLSQAPTNPEACHLDGIIHMARGELPEALAQLRQAVALAPSVAAYHNALADALRQAGARDEAMAHYRTVLTLDPSHHYAAQSLAELAGQTP